MRSAKKPPGENDELGAGLDKVRNGCFHASATGAGDGHGECIFGAVGGLETGTDLFVDLEEEWIEVADDRLAHCFIDARGRRVTGRGPKSKRFGGANGANEDDMRTSLP